MMQTQTAFQGRYVGWCIAAALVVGAAAMDVGAGDSNRSPALTRDGWTATAPRMNEEGEEFSALAQKNEMDQELKLEVAGLRSPSRIDEIARNQLGLTMPVAGQIEPVGGPDVRPQPQQCLEERSAVA